MENETARASGGRSGQDAEGWTDIEEELDSFVAASEATPARVQDGTPREDEVREVLDSKSGKLQAAETRETEKKTATARTSGVHHLGPDVETRTEAQAAAGSERLKNAHDLASFLAGKVRMTRETGANLTLMFLIGTAGNAFMIRAVPWRSEPGWTGICAWPCACSNGPNQISARRPMTISTRSPQKQSHTTSIGRGKQPDPPSSPHTASGSGMMAFAD